MEGGSSGSVKNPLFVVSSRKLASSLFLERILEDDLLSFICLDWYSNEGNFIRGSELQVVIERIDMGECKWLGEFESWGLGSVVWDRDLASSMREILAFRGKNRELRKSSCARSCWVVGWIGDFSDDLARRREREFIVGTD